MFEFLKSQPTCAHEWQLISKTYAPPLKEKVDVIALAANDKHIIQQYLNGVTTLLFECAICHQLNKQEVLGSDENQLHEVFEKVEQFGLQIVKHEDKMYGIGRYLPETKADTLPLR